jgi:hypothetical protein
MAGLLTAITALKLITNKSGCKAEGQNATPHSLKDEAMIRTMSFLVIFMAVIAVSGCAIIEAGPGRTRP